MKKQCRGIRIFWGIVAILFLFLFICGDDGDAYLYLLSNKPNIVQIINNNFFKTAGKMDEDDYTLDATNGTGLNLLLIDNIQTESYVKELLELCRENQEGDLSKKNYGAHADIQTILGIWISECGFYSESNSIIPNSALPWDSSIGAPLWNKPYKGMSASTMTLRQLTSTAIRELGINFNGGRGPFSYDNTCYGIAKINGYKQEASRLVGDKQYVPDGLVGLDTYIKSGANTLGIEDLTALSNEAISALCGIAHNMGAGSGCFYGVRYQANSSYFDATVLTDVQKSEYISWFVNAINKATKDGVRVSDFFSIAKSYTLPPIIAINDGWFIDQTCFEYLINRSSESIKAYNVVFPNDKITNTAQLETKLKGYTKSIGEATGYTTTELQRYYGFNTSPRDNFSSSMVSHRQSGIFFKVGNNTKLYKNAGKHGAKQLQWYTPISAEHIAYPVIGGPYIYAKLLKFAGVNVDPTNPDTYLNKIKSDSNDTWIPGDTNWMTEVGVDIKGLSSNRIKVLNAAYKMIQEKYVYVYGLTGESVASYEACRMASVRYGGLDYNNSSNLRIFYKSLSYPVRGADCSGYAYLAYKDAGFKLEDGTTSYIANSSQWKEIGFSQLKPGDLINIAGRHVVLWIGGNKSNMNFTCMEAPSSGKYIKFSKNRNMSGAKAYRLKGFD